MQKIKVSLVGYGYWGPKLARNFQNSNFFNLISIIRYKYEGMLNEQFLPLKIPLVDLNLIYNVTITKNV